MKKLIYIAFSLLLAGGVAACTQDTPNPVQDEALKVVSGNVNFDYLGGRKTIVVESASKPAFETKQGATWCVVGYEGNNIVVETGRYAGKTSRTTTITVTADNKKVVIPVTQTALYLNSEADSLYMDWNATTRQFNVLPGQFPETKAIADQAWMVVGVNDANTRLTLSPTNNTTLAIREANVTITITTPAGIDPVADPEYKQTKTFKVIQRSQLTTNETSLKFTKDAASKDLTFSFNGAAAAPVTAEILYEKADVTGWVTTSVDDAAKKVSVTVTATDKIVDRKAVMVLKVGGNVAAKVDLTQEKRSVIAADIYGVYDVKWSSYMDYLNWNAHLYNTYSEEELSTGTFQYILGEHMFTCSGVVIKQHPTDPSKVVVTGLFKGSNNGRVNSLQYVQYSIGPFPEIETISFEGDLDLSIPAVKISAETPYTGYATGSEVISDCETQTYAGQAYNILFTDQGKASEQFGANYMPCWNISFLRTADNRRFTFQVERVWTWEWTRTSTVIP